MELRQIEFFLEVAKQRNFTKAAENLFVAQPAISKSIKNLENELGVYLFTRNEKNIRLTPEGERFYQYAATIYEQVQLAKLEMSELAGLEKGEVTLGLPSMVGSYYFPKIIINFKKKYPQLQISLFEAGTKKIQSALEEGKIDLGVVVSDRIQSNQLESISFLQEEMVVCMPKTHPLAQQKSITYEQLAAEPLVLFKEGYFQRDIIEKVVEKTGMKANVTLETDQISLTKSLTRKGFGITLFLKMVISDDPDLIGVSLNPPVYVDLSLAWKKKAYFSKANEAFLQFFMIETAQLQNKQAFS